jgi:hypothetical protein
MKKTLALLALVLLLGFTGSATAQALVGQGWSSSSTAISAVGGTTTGYYPTAAGINISNATAALVHVVSASTSTSTVYIEGSVNGSSWYALSSAITNATSSGELWAGPAPRYIRVNLSSHGAGTISAYVAWRQLLADPIATSWHLLSAQATSFSFTAPALGAATGTSLTLTGNATANHFLGTGTAPTTDAGSSTCGTTAPSIAGKDTGGQITVGSVSGTVCHVNFGTAFGNAPACVASAQTATNVKVTTTTAAATLTGTFTAGEVIQYACFAY